jgi:hypothetical protein
MTQLEEYSESRLEPESVLPSQFFDSRKNKQSEEGVRRLILAVLTDAVRCYQVGLDAKMAARRRVFREAKQWLSYSRADGGPFSFENVCGALDITPDYVRDVLRRWQAGKLRGANLPIVRRSPVIPAKSAAVRRRKFGRVLDQK